MNVSVDHWRARLRAVRQLTCSPVSQLCQSIIGALACAPLLRSSDILPLQSVSRSLARSPARRRKCLIQITRDILCQSIIGALACAPRSSRAWAAILFSVSRSLARSPARRNRDDSLGQCNRQCQSIIGALACAPPSRRRSYVADYVSVDHWRARLRAHIYSTAITVTAGVSRSLARSPARRRIV